MKTRTLAGYPVKCILLGAVALVPFIPSARAELVAWWDFNQPANGGFTMDQRGGQRAQMLSGAVLTPDAEGRTGSAGDVAARFGTGAQRLRAPGDYFTGAFAGNTGTVSFWIKQTTLRSSTSISFVAPSVGGRGWQAHTPWGDAPNYNLYFDTGGCCDGTMRVFGLSGMTTGVWHHVALVRGPDIAPGEPDLTNKWAYVNGALVASGTNNAPLALAFTEFFIGNAPNTGEAVDGDIDDVAVFSQPLSQAEVAQLAAGDSPLTLATEPTDTDSDGLPDLWETYRAPGALTQLGASPADFDLDGLEDVEELAMGTNPNDPDTDSDGLDDIVETGTGTWMSASDTGTDPFVADTDGDTLLDGVEDNSGTFMNAGATGTNPHLPDTDGDLINDGSEIIYGSNPTNPDSTPVQPGVPTLLAWWEFDDDANPATATDTRAGIVANMVNAAGYTADGGGMSGQQGDRALNVGAAGNGLRASQTDWLNIGTRLDRLTVTFWQRNTSNPQASSFWMNSPAPGIGGRGMQAHVPWSDGTIYFDHAGASGASQRIAGNPNPNPGLVWTQWHHFAFVKVGGRKAIYIDGVLFLDQAAGAASFPTDFNTLFIGYDGGGNSVNGQIDDFAVFASGLGEQDIMDLASGAKTPLDVASSSDADGDGLADSWEFTYFPADLTKLGAAPADFDSDGSLDEEEIVRNTFPTDDDSDDDGLLDGSETDDGQWVDATHTGTDPLDADTDGDSFPDGIEDCSGVYVSQADPGTDPNLFDTDSDGFSDSVEGPYGFDPNDMGSLPFAPGESFLLAYWKFDDATDPGAALDSVVGHAGAVTSTYSAPGEGSSGTGSDRAMCFAPGQGVTANANFVNLASSGNKLTISFWQKLTSVQSTSSFWINSPSSVNSERGFQAHVPWGDRNIYFDHSGCCDAGVTRLNTAVPIPEAEVNFSEWHHFAFVKDGDNKHVYIDGVVTVSGLGTAPLVNDFTTLLIGFGNGAASIDGCMDEFAIFAGALDPEQITRLAAGETADTILLDPAIFQVTDIVFNDATDEFTLTWNSKPNRTYSLFFSLDMQDFGADISDSIGSGGTTTTYGPFTLPFELGEEIFFRVRENP